MRRSCRGLALNLTADRRSERPSLGVSCFDCHQNGSTNGATHQVGDIRPQQFRHRIDTPTLRGVNVQRLFGSQRALKTVEDFTEFEQRAAYFDGDPVIATKKGVNILERGSQVHDMAEFQEILDFPPAPKLDVFGKVDPKRATPEELRGQALFFGKGGGILQPDPRHPAHVGRKAGSRGVYASAVTIIFGSRDCARALDLESDVTSALDHSLGLELVA